MIHLDDGQGKPKCGAKAVKDGSPPEVIALDAPVDPFDGCYACVAVAIHIDDGNGKACCGAENVELTDSALASGCEKCRGEIMVGGAMQTGCAPKPAPEYVPEPMPDADAILEEKKRRVDGR